MKRVYVTVGSRVEHEGDKPEDKGEFLAIDWEAKEIVGSYSADSGKEVKVGRSRGASGLSWHDDRIYVTTRLGVTSIDPDSYEQVSSPKTGLGGYHGMDSDGHTLWLTCHGTDCLLAIRDDEVKSVLCTTKYGTNQVPVEESNGLNAVGFSPSGEMFVMYAHKGQIFNWSAQKVAVDTRTPDKNNPGYHSPHDITFVDEDHCLYTQSSIRRLWKANVRTGEKQCVVDHGPLYNKGGAIHDAGTSHAIPGWLRAVAYHEDSNTVFMSSAPGTIIEYDSTNWKERSRFVFTERREANPFEIILDPRDWT